MSGSLLNLEQLLSAVNGQLIESSSKKNFGFTSVVTDSRNVVNGSLFVPLVGEFQDGHKYIPQAMEKGAAVVFVNSAEDEKSKTLYAELDAKSDCVFVVVQNTLHALQAAARSYAAKVSANMIRVSITGSSGKTTTKEMLVSVCKEFYGQNAVAYTKGNFNSETGLPLSMFQIKGDEKIGIFEMGMNRVNEIGEISAVWKSQYGIITNIGNAHIGILGSRQNIANEKRKSFDYIPSSGAAFVPADDDFADYCTQNVKGQVVKFGKSVGEEVSGVKFIEDMGLRGTRFAVDGLEVCLGLPGEYNYQKALGVIALAKKLGINRECIKTGLEKVSAVAGRMEIKEGKLKSGVKASVVCDCYNANPDSMKKAVEFCSGIECSGNKIFILGDMKELGEKAVQAHKDIGFACAECGADLVILTGSDMKNAAQAIEEKNKALEVLYFENNDDNFFTQASAKVLKAAKDGAVILIKGSHSMELQKLIPLVVMEGAN